jgi:hypothetical protein
MDDRDRSTSRYYLIKYDRIYAKYL